MGSARTLANTRNLLGVYSNAGDDGQITGRNYLYNRFGIYVRFDYFEGGYLVYQCLATPALFKSTNYKLNEFVAHNGVKVCSKNSPVISDLDHIFLEGAFGEFDRKPSVLYVGTPEQFEVAVLRFVEALHHLGTHLELPPTCSESPEA